MRKKLENIQMMYRELCESLSTLVRNEEEAHMLIWLNVSELIKMESVPYQIDCMGYLLRLITGDTKMLNLNRQIVTDEKMRSQLIEKYNMADNIKALGSYWKELLEGEKIFRLRILEAVIHNIKVDFFPYCKQEILDWNLKVNEVGNKGEELIKSQYRKAMKNLLGAERIISTAIDLYELRNTKEQGMN